MTENYSARMKHKFERLLEISRELDALVAQAADLLGGAADPREETVLAQLGEARQGLAGYLPTAQVAASAAEGRTSAAMDYLNGKYGSAQTGRPGGQS